LRDAAFGTMSDSYSTQNVPCHVIYRVSKGDALGATRTACLVMTRTPAGDPEASPKSNYGEFRIRQDGPAAVGSVRPFPWIVTSSLPGERFEYRLELQITEHLPLDRPVEKVFFNNQPVHVETELPAAIHGGFCIEDGSIRLQWSTDCAIPVRFHIARKNGLLICCVILPSDDTTLDFQLDISGA